MTSEPASSKPTENREQDSDVCPKCNGVLVPTQWLAQQGEYPVNEVVIVPGVCCADCNYMRFEYDPHGSTQP